MGEALNITACDIEIWGRSAFGCYCTIYKKVSPFREFVIELGWDFRELQPIRRGLPVSRRLLLKIADSVAIEDVSIQIHSQSLDLALESYGDSLSSLPSTL